MNLIKGHECERVLKIKKIKLFLHSNLVIIVINDIHRFTYLV